MKEKETNLVQKDKKKPNIFASKIVPAFSRLSNNRVLSLIRDVFGIFLPVIVAGSMASILNALIFASGGGGAKMSLIGWLDAWITHTSIDDVTTSLQAQVDGWGKVANLGNIILGAIQEATINSMSIYIAAGIGYLVAKQRGTKNPILVAMLSEAVFLIAYMNAVDWARSANGLLGTLIFCILGSEFYCWLAKNERLKIKMPAGVPPAIASSFSMLIPFVIVFATTAAVSAIFVIPAIFATNWAITSGASATITFDPAGLTRILGLTNAGIASPETIQSVVAAFNSEMLRNGIVLTQGQLDSLQANIAEFIKYSGTFVMNLNAIASGTLQSADQIQQALNAMNSSLDQMNVFTSSLNGSESATLGIFLQWYIAPTAAFDYSSVFDNLQSGGALTITPIQANLPVVGLQNAAFTISASYKSLLVPSSQFGAGEAIYFYVAAPLTSLVGGVAGLPILIFAAFVCMFLWFFGVHGTNVLQGVLLPVLMPMYIANMMALNTYGTDALTIDGGSHMYWTLCLAYQMGGTGNILPIAFLGKWLSKRKSIREISKYGIPCTIFQISEPVIFGLPLILNWVFFIPFVFGFLPASLPAIIGVYWAHWATPTAYTVPWATPSILYEFLGTLDPKRMFLAICSMAIAFGYWYPFLLIDNKLYMNELKANDPEMYEKRVLYYKDLTYKVQVDYEDKKVDLEDKRVANLVMLKKRKKDLEAKLSSLRDDLNKRYALNENKDEIVNKKVHSFEEYVNSQNQKIAVKSEKVTKLIENKSMKIDKWFEVHSELAKNKMQKRAEKQQTQVANK